MDIHIITLFPRMFDGPFGESIIKKAEEKGLIRIYMHNLRDFGIGKRKNTDDYSYGGGGGMVIKIEPVYKALEKIKGILLPPDKEDRTKNKNGKTILLSPQGEIFTEEKAKKLAKESFLIFICGHYKGTDERIRENLVDEEISIGDYILTGGEIPTIVMVDAIVRLIPGVVGNEESLKLDSFYQNLLEGPLYTRPVNFKGMRVPDVLLSGNHQRILLWRRKEALRRTYVRRSYLLDRISLTEEDKTLLEEIRREEA